MRNTSQEKGLVLLAFKIMLFMDHNDPLFKALTEGVKDTLLDYQELDDLAKEAAAKVGLNIAKK